MAGNWKMYKTPPETTAFFEKFRPLVANSTQTEIVIFPPFVNLAVAAQGAEGTHIEIVRIVSKSTSNGPIETAQMRNFIVALGSVDAYGIMSV